MDQNASSIPGAEAPAPPAPLLRNGGTADATSYFSDIQMMELLNGKERTVAQFGQLLDQTGWKLVQVIRQGGLIVTGGKLVAIPA